MSEVGSRGVALVTGAGSGLGASVALRLAARGLVVAVNTRSRVEDAEKVVEQIRRSGGDGFVVPADVSDRRQVLEMVATVAERGVLRALVSSASFRPRQPFRTITADDWTAVRGTTLDAAFWCAQACVPLMESGATIVHLLGRNAMVGDPARVHVSAAKHGLVGLTLALAQALREEGIAVNAVSPGVASSCARPEECRNRVAETVASLAAPRNAMGSMVTGAVHDVDCDDLSRLGQEP